MRHPERKTLRLPNFDYSSANYYFLTVCTHEKACIFGSTKQLNRLGKIAEGDILNLENHFSGVKVDSFVVMPNHIHLILILEGESEDRPSVSKVMSLYKAGVSRKIREFAPDSVIWQRSFYEHVIRNLEDYENIWNYIADNPRRWEQDRFHQPVPERNVAGGMNPAPTRSTNVSTKN